MTHCVEAQDQHCIAPAPLPERKMIMVQQTGTAWYMSPRARKQNLSCKCQLGCPELADHWGYDRQMNTVPLAPGHGRKENGS